jgi:hypothetical protein
MEAWKSKQNKKYSPAIRSELMARLYRERKRRCVPMTKLLNWIVEKALLEWEAEVLPEVQGAGENGVRTMGTREAGDKAGKTTATIRPLSRLAVPSLFIFTTWVSNEYIPLRRDFLLAASVRCRVGNV